MLIYIWPANLCMFKITLENIAYNYSVIFIMVVFNLIGQSQIKNMKIIIVSHATTLRTVSQMHYYEISRFRKYFVL